MIIGRFIKKIRTNNKIRIIEVANASNVSQPYISNIENGKRVPTIGMFLKIIHSIASLSEVYGHPLLKPYVLFNYNFGELNKYETRKSNNGEIIELDSKDWEKYFSKEELINQLASCYIEVLLSSLGYNDTLNSYSEEEAIEIILKNVDESEKPIIKGIFEIGRDNLYDEKLTNVVKLMSSKEDKFIDLSILFDNTFKSSFLLDSLNLSKSELDSIRILLNGIRYNREQ